MPQHARLEIAHAAEWINQCAMLVLGNRIDGEIAATQIVFKRDIGAGVEGKALIAAPGLALGTRQRVLFSCLRIEEDREILADRLVAERSEEHTSELQSLMRSSYAGFCLTKKNKTT